MEPDDDEERAVAIMDSIVSGLDASQTVYGIFPPSSLESAANLSCKGNMEEGRREMEGNRKEIVTSG